MSSAVSNIGPEMITLGCRLNIAESDAIKDNINGGDDLIVVNSCAVTNEAVRQTRQAIRRAKKASPDKQIIVTGCAAQVDPKMFAAMPEVARVVGNFDKYDQNNFAFSPDTGESDQDIRVSDVMQVTETAPHMVSAFTERSRAFVEVQNGCDHRCTFCIIPYGRGNSRSVPAGLIVDKINELVDLGFREVVITGVDVTSYGHDLPGRPDMGQLIERIMKYAPKLDRLRLSSLDGIEIDDRLFDLLTGEPRLMPHVHLSLQSGDDLILKRMKRRHSRKQAVDLVERLKAKRPEIAIGADIIAGFPTETAAMFENSVKLIEDCQVVHGHIFPYSPKQGTPAAKMPQVKGDVIKERARILRDANKTSALKWRNSLIGTEQRVLVEGNGQSGHAENFANVTVNGDGLEGEIIRCTITGLDQNGLIAESAPSNAFQSNVRNIDSRSQNEAKQ